ncbi:MAG: signal peptidase I [Elusimicrobiota bacterium]|jgi:signal peptidase I|nr:signal peptidase I [Elusimicrobiota bacterium]
MEMETKLFIAGLAFLAIAIIMKILKKIIYGGQPPEIWFKLYSLIDTAWTALLIASLIMFLFIQAFKIPSGSMRNTLLEGDHLFVNKFIYGLHIPFADGKRVFPMRQIKRGDIIVFRAPVSALSPEEKAKNINKDFIKRCVGLPGDTIEIKDKVLYVNGIAQSEPYVLYGDKNTTYLGVLHGMSDYQQEWESGNFVFLGQRIRDNFGPVVVPEGYFMMMGDNRDFSFDSRFFGPVKNELIKGKALFLYWPLSRIRIIK